MFTVESVKNPAWRNAEHTLIECEVKFAEMDTYVPFGASVEGDQYAHTKEVFDRVVAGEFGSIQEYIAPSEPQANQPTVNGAQTL